MQRPSSPPELPIEYLRERFTALFQTPELLPWQLDIPGKRLLFALMSEPAYRDASFLDQRLNLDGRLQAMWAPLERVLADQAATARTPSSADFVFHVGHCGSTLLSRLLAEGPALLPLREPLSLRTLAEHERMLHQPGTTITHPEWQSLMELLLHLLTRVYRKDQRALIKLSSNCNNLISPLLASNPEHKAVFLYLNLRSYLASVLRPQSRGALRAFSKDRTFDLQRLMPDVRIALEDLSPARLGAVNWATSMAYFARAQSEARLSARIQLVEFETFLRNPVDALVELFGFLGHLVERDAATAILQSGHMGRYAKDMRVGYSPELRAEDLEQSMRVHRDDIDDAQAWLTDMLSRASGLALLKDMVGSD